MSTPSELSTSSTTANQIFRSRLCLALQGTSLVKASKRSGYSKCYIRRLRDGVMINPSISTVWALAEALSVSPAWMLGLENADDCLYERDLRTSCSLRPIAQERK